MNGKFVYHSITSALAKYAIWNRVEVTHSLPVWIRTFVRLLARSQILHCTVQKLEGAEMILFTLLLTGL